MTRPEQAGFVLPLTVAAVLALSMAMLPIFEGVGVAVDRTQRARDRLAAAVAMEEAATDVSLATATQGATAGFEADGRPYAVGRAVASAQDLRGLVSLDGIAGALLQRFLIGLGVAPDRAPGLVDAYFDFIDADDLSRAGGGERDAYLAAGLPPPRDGPLAAAAEARDILGWREEPTLWTDQAWERAATARGPGGFNPATAPRPALLSIEGVSPDLADRILAAPERSLELLPAAGADARTWVRNPSGAIQLTVSAGGAARRIELRTTALDPARPWRVDWSLPIPLSSSGLPRTHDDLPAFPPLRVHPARP